MSDVKLMREALLACRADYADAMDEISLMEHVKTYPERMANKVRLGQIAARIRMIDYALSERVSCENPVKPETTREYLERNQLVKPQG